MFSETLEIKNRYGLELEDLSKEIVGCKLQEFTVYKLDSWQLMFSFYKDDNSSIRQVYRTFFRSPPEGLDIITLALGKTVDHLVVDEKSIKQIVFDDGYILSLS